MNKSIPLPPSTILDDKLFTSFLGKESPNELIIQGHNISEIGSISKEGASLRRLDISFNSLVNFKGIDQFNRLRQLSAYCCRLNNIDHICGTPHLQTLLLQQNGLVDFSPSFKQLKQLRELRIDRNQLSCISNLGNCSSLRILDISFNSVESLAGISGLQSLEELRATNNNITSLQTLKSLPSLRYYSY
jgi:Leucine-rich repeat (LRR) protein